MALPHCITCLLLSLLFILVVLLICNGDHSVHLEKSCKNFSYQVQAWRALTVFYWQGGTAGVEQHLEGISQIVWFCSICLSWHTIPPRSNGIPETHLVPPGQPSDLAIEQSGDTISWHLGEGCVGGLALSTLIAVNFQTWVNPMEIWPSLPSLPLQPPGKHSMSLN